MGSEYKPDCESVREAVDNTAMIGRLSGILVDKAPPQVVVDVQGVGYEVDVPMSTFYNLPAAGEKVSLLTHFVVREDAQILYGFGTAPERATFRQLIKISGVGPRTALSILSGMGVDELAPRGLVHQLGEQLAGIAVVHAVDRVGMARDIKSAPAVDRVAPVQPPADRR